LEAIRENKLLKSEKIEEMKAIVDRAEKKDRGLKDHEKRKIDQLENEIDKLDKEITQEQKEIDRVKEEILREDGVKTNMNPKIYTRDRLNDYENDIQSRSEFDDRKISAGSCIRSLITGTWKNEDEKRAMNTTTDSAGGYVVPDAIASTIISEALDKTVVLRAGGRMFDMQEKTVTVPRIDDSPEGTFKIENEPYVFGDLTFAGVELEAKVLMAGVRLSMELAEDGQDIERHIENSLSESIALALDKAALKGDGSDANPEGILHTSGIQEIDSATDLVDLTDYDVISEAVEKIEDENGEANAVVYNPKIKGNFDRLKDTTNQPLVMPQSAQGLNKFVTNTLDNDEIFVGDFRQLLWGIRSNLRVEVSREAEDAFSKGQVLVRAYLRADIALGRPNNFVVIGETA